MMHFNFLEKTNTTDITYMSNNQGISDWSVHTPNADNISLTTLLTYFLDLLMFLVGAEIPGRHCFNAIRKGLTSVPTNIPPTWTGTRYLAFLGLNGNYITAISPEAFSSLIWLKTRWLGSNYLGKINEKMWVGLESL